MKYNIITSPKQTKVPLTRFWLVAAAQSNDALSGAQGLVMKCRHQILNNREYHSTIPRARCTELPSQLQDNPNIIIIDHVHHRIDTSLLLSGQDLSISS